MIDLNEEMKKDPADRAEGSFKAFLDAALQYGQNKGEISENDADKIRDAGKHF